MNDAPSSTPSADTEALRRQWLAHAGAAFDLMFHPDHQTDLVSFDQRERRVCELMGDLGAWLLQRQANADPAAVPPEGHAVACPKCGRRADRVSPPDDPLPGRPLKTDIGDIELKRQQYTCTTCRVVFFPPRP
jgi:hypothetical protein